MAGENRRFRAGPEALATVAAAIKATSSVADSLAHQVVEMRDASAMVNEIMSAASASVEKNAGAASEMRTTTSTSHVTDVMIPIAATASRNAAVAQQASLSTSQLAIGIGEIGVTARSLRDQAEQLASLLATFTVDDDPSGSAPAARKREALVR